MRFLHASGVLHGDLRAANVLVDASFSAKLTDYARATVLPPGPPPPSPPPIVGASSHLAPELLRGGPPSPASDVYAFGVTLYETFSRNPDFWAPEELLAMVADVADVTLDPPRRPWGFGPPPASLCPAVFRSLMERCCAGDPVDRPSFVAIAAELHALDMPGLVDKMLESHAQSDDLLHNVFPPRVAKALKEGRPVEPESYDSVTIFFSDIVGFTDISATLPPALVMNMLNRLYTAFDALTLKHGLFKVETIGDAYMSVGNLPVSGQDWPCADHTARVARFAIDAVQAASSIFVQLDDVTLGSVTIRAGFHSGPVVASVVGSANPRFCLFGDTVNTASRCESNSLPGRITLSAAAAALLVAQAPEMERQLESRGRVTVKGKGKMPLFFLNAGPAVEGKARRLSISAAHGLGTTAQPAAAELLPSHE